MDSHAAPIAHRHPIRRCLAMNALVAAALLAFTIIWHLLMPEPRILDLPALMLALGFAFVSIVDGLINYFQRLP